MSRNVTGFLGALALSSLLLAASATPTLAGLKLCNKTESNIGVALGYKNKDGWATEGWWNFKPQQCRVMLKDLLIAQYYYVYAIDYDKGGSWGGKSMMCKREKIFTIKGFDKCEERGFTKVGFFEVDTGEQTDWTISLSGDKTTQGP